MLLCKHGDGCTNWANLPFLIIHINETRCRIATEVKTWTSSASRTSVSGYKGWAHIKEVPRKNPFLALRHREGQFQCKSLYPSDISFLTLAQPTKTWKRISDPPKPAGRYGDITYLYFFTGHSLQNLKRVRCIDVKLWSRWNLILLLDFRDFGGGSTNVTEVGIPNSTVVLRVGFWVEPK